MYMKKIDIRPGKENLFYNELGKRPIFVKFYMDGCPHCENMKVDWEELENELLNNYDGNFTIMSVNARALKTLNHPILNDIQGFPTIFMINERGQKIADYSGERTKNEMLNFILQNSNVQKKQSTIDSFRSVQKPLYQSSLNSVDSLSIKNEYNERKPRKNKKHVSFVRKSGKYKLKRRRTKHRKTKSKSKMHRRRVSRKNK